MLFGEARCLRSYGQLCNGTKTSPREGQTSLGTDPPRPVCCVLLSTLSNCCQGRVRPVLPLSRVKPRRCLTLTSMMCRQQLHQIVQHAAFATGIFLPRLRPSVGSHGSSSRASEGLPGNSDSWSEASESSPLAVPRYSAPRSPQLLFSQREGRPTPVDYEGGRRYTARAERFRVPQTLRKERTVLTQ